ncbi:MAG: Flp pilus assembly protein CpaB [Clostridiales bacterium 38-18]|nr:MAG: Flp pilus assembly protein CpaB [Clostridiales bacterium 38-18]
MKRSGLLVFMMSLILALLGAGAIFVYLKSLDRQEVVQVKTISVVVAKEEIPSRTKITGDMLNVVDVVETGVVGGYMNEISSVIGQFATETIFSGQQIHPNMIAEAIENDLSMKITGNNRAMTITVNGDSGVNGLIKVGDYVDVILNLPAGSDQGRISRPDIAKLFLQNIEVIAVNKNIFRNSSNATGDGNLDSSSYLMTLSIPIMDVEMMSLAETIGSIKLVLRPKEGDYLYVTEGAIWQELLLNDMGQMKDMAPEYSIIGEEPLAIAPGEYNYDQYVYYVVEYGDTLQSISMKFYNTEALYTLIQQVNKIVDENMILTGTGIKIPVLKERGDTNGN